ncbi:MAG: DUF3343 domain-containing protein [Deltaproteobacteria bacterium]|nr:DUF3343 domain-containing protein [Deltaproteobacteria bacterium]
MEFILTFGSVHRVLKAEGILKEAGVAFRLMPTPKALEKVCDLVILTGEGELFAAKDALFDAGLPPRNIYRREGDDCVKV